MRYHDSLIMHLEPAQALHRVPRAPTAVWPTRLVRGSLAQQVTYQKGDESILRAPKNTYQKGNH